MLRFLFKFDSSLASLERAAACFIVIALPILVLINIASRALRMPIYWMDELAILAMVWLAMLTMSITLKTRDAVAVTLLLDKAPEAILRLLKILVDILVFLFGFTLLLLSYIWFDPINLYLLDFNTKLFGSETFNFIYQEKTNTLGLSKFWFWIIVPFAAFCTCIHAISNLFMSLFPQSKPKSS